jgi:hypothetical protein
MILCDVVVQGSAMFDPQYYRCKMEQEKKKNKQIKTEKNIKKIFLFFLL